MLRALAPREKRLSLSLQSKNELPVLLTMADFSVSNVTIGVRGLPRTLQLVRLEEKGKK